MAKLVCEKCGLALEEIQFYSYRNGDKCELCKKCLTLHVDNFDPQTYVWILEKLDFPYVPEYWDHIRDTAYAKNPKKMTGVTVLGRYLSKMRIKPNNGKGWADSEAMRAEVTGRQEVAKQMDVERQQMLTERYEKGDISEAEYRTLMDTAVLKEQDYVSAAAKANVTEAASSEIIGEDNPFDESQFCTDIEVPDLESQLTQEDKLSLLLKWGRKYTVAQWLELEGFYRQMEGSFAITDADTDNALKHLCKINLKMNEAIDANDIETYQKLSRVFDTMRKSAKFTAAQKKEQTQNFVDSCGQLVLYCEKWGGKIPRYEIKQDYDIIDTVIRDLKSYTASLVKEDTAIAQQIETYLKKRELAEAKKDDTPVTDDDLAEKAEQIRQEQAEDQLVMSGRKEEEK